MQLDQKRTNYINSTVGSNSQYAKEVFIQVNEVPPVYILLRE